MTTTTSTSRCLLALGAAMVLAGCAGSEALPTEQIGIARASIEQAEQSGVETDGRPALESARDKLASAERAAADDEHAIARRLAEEATADAELAAAQAEAAESEAAAAELRAAIGTLQREIE